jgi:hypothetical protein
MLEKGVDPRDLTNVRDAQIVALYNLCQLLDSSAYGIEELQAKIPENVEWRLVEYNGETDELGRVIEGTHEMFHEADPSGRGGRPVTRKLKAKRARPAKKPTARRVRRTRTK